MKRVTPDPKPLTTELAEQIMEIRSRIHELLVQSSLVYEDFSNSSVVFVGSSSYWAALADDGRVLQWELHKDARRWFDLVAQLVADRGEQLVGQAKEIRKFCEQVIDQHDAMHERNTDDVARRLWRELDEQLVVLKGLYSESSAPTFVPDTNALIHNTALDEWDLSPGTIFDLILTPTVLNELDSLKNGRSDHPRTEKAARLVRQIKGYRGRGNLLKGVSLRRGRSVLSAQMPEPVMSRSLSWLDPTIPDDRFIASALEIVKLRPAAPVAIVTGDVHMQTKLELVGLRFVEPPDAHNPSSSSTGDE